MLGVLFQKLSGWAAYPSSLKTIKVRRRPFPTSLNFLNKLYNLAYLKSSKDIKKLTSKLINANISIETVLPELTVSPYICC